jgi:hypothetical protein
VIDPELGFDPVVVGTQFGVYLLWLVFVCWCLSRMIRDFVPPTRAALCVAAGVGLTWAPAILPKALTLSVTLPESFGWGDVIVQAGAPLAVFLFGWWWFQSHWIDREEIADIFK